MFTRLVMSRAHVQKLRTNYSHSLATNERLHKPFSGLVRSLNHYQSSEAFVGAFLGLMAQQRSSAVAAVSFTDQLQGAVGFPGNRPLRFATTRPHNLEYQIVSQGMSLHIPEVGRGEHEVYQGESVRHNWIDPTQIRTLLPAAPVLKNGSVLMTPLALNQKPLGYFYEYRPHYSFIVAEIHEALTYAALFKYELARRLSA